MQRFFYIVFFLFLSQVALSQADSSYIEFAAPGYGFGQVYENDGQLLLEFTFKNSGNKPLVINRIVGPAFKELKFSNKLVAAGDSGSIRVVVEPNDRVGIFNKKLLVFSNAMNSPSEMVVKGKILAGSSVGGFNYEVGGLAFKYGQLNFGYVFNGEELTRFVPVKNISTEVVCVEFNDVPDHVYIQPKFDSLMPGQNAMLEVRYNTKKINDWDFVIDKVKVDVICKEVHTGTISVTANIREDFKKLSDDEMMSRPEISIPIQVFNFDTIPSDHITFYDFLITNKGDRTLDIRAVKPTCGCTAVMPVKNSIEPGDSTFIKVAFDAKGFSGYSKKGVTVITNDPENYKQFLWVTGYIEDEPGVQEQTPQQKN